MQRLFLLALILVLVLLFWPSAQVGGLNPVLRAGGAAVPPTPTVLAAGPGLTLWNPAEPERLDRRGFRHLGLLVPEGGSVSEFLAAGRFVAEFRGVLEIPTRDRFIFHAVGSGEVVFELGGKTMLEPGTRSSKARRIKKGKHPFLLRYTSPVQGDAQLRLEWQARDFAREPVPARLIDHEALPFGDGLRRRGRQLVVAGRCAQCHVGLDLRGPAGPLLIGHGARVRHDWLVQWLRDPASLRPHTEMPQLLHGPGAAQAAADVAAAVLAGAEPTTVELSGAAEGAKTFASHGCIACHTLPDGSRDPRRIPLDMVAAKWHPAALRAFLQNPQASHPTGGMPDYGFDEATAGGLAAFLLDKAKGSVPAAPAGDAARGRQWIAALGCANCHGYPVASQLRTDKAPLTAAGSPDCRLALYPHSDADRQALVAFLRSTRPGPESDMDHARDTLRAGRCLHCHADAGRPALLQEVRGEVGEALGPLQAPPDLGPVGSKLQSGWLQAWLAGEVTERPRPWMDMPMPRCQVDAERLARGLAQLQGFGSSASPYPGAPREGAQPALGQDLLTEEKGFGCNQCHAVGAQKAHAFEAPGPNLRQAPARLRPAFYQRWMLQPERVDPGSKMTRFADAKGRTGLGEVLGGDARAQFEAIWRFLELK